MTDDRHVRKLRKQLETALVKRDDEAAAELLAQLIEIEPTAPRWPHKRGELLRKLGQNRAAVECYATAATLYAEQGFVARAVAMATTVLNIDPSRIDILERVDPEAGRKLHRRLRPNSVSARAESRPMRKAPARHPALLEDDPPGPPPARHPAILPDDEPDDHAPAPMRHPAILPDDDDVPQLPEPITSPRAAKRDKSPAQREQPAAAPPKRHPMVLDDALSMPPAELPRRAQPPARAPSTRLDGLVQQPKHPPPRIVPAPPKVPDLSANVLELAEELTIAPDVRPNETRFSNAPPARTLEIELTDLEFAERTPVSPRVKSSLPPPPPSPRKLSQLPLFPLFAEVPKSALALLVQGAEVIELSDGELVMRKGDTADALYGIVEGSVQIGVPGQHMRLTLAEGDVFGESALLAGEKRHADVTVKGYLVALRISRPVLNQLLGAHPPLAEVLLELLTRRLLGNLLQASPLFQEFDVKGRQEVARMFEVRRAPSGTLLADAGKMMDGLYINLTGELEVFAAGEPTEIHGAGTMFGQASLLTHQPSLVSVRALNNMLVLRLPGTAFHTLVMQYPAILAHVSEHAGSAVAHVGT